MASGINSSRDAMDRKHCWVCFLSEEDDEVAEGAAVKSLGATNQPDSADEWVKPCKCKGSAKWVHQSCLQRWIDEKQKSNPSLAVACSQCKTEYILIFPKAGTFLNIIEMYDRFLYGASPFAAGIVVIGSIYWSAVSYGALTVLQVFGHDDGKAVLESADPLMLLIGLPSIPFMLIAGKLFRWEDQILRLWKNHYQKLPCLSYFIGEPAPDVRDSAERILIGRDSYSDPISSTRLFCGALVLPTVSSLFGRFLFPSVDSHLKRTLLGGVTFILAKGLLRVVLRQQQYIRQSKRKVVNYNDVNLTVDKASSTEDA